ncbi:hypothetical protein J6590_032552 [Homalodisca vitripennis]|nr:hypothetical protein J6590_032552 [Homalodisca vitripennis]
MLVIRKWRARWWTSELGIRQLLSYCLSRGVPVSVSQLVRFVVHSPFSFVVYALQFCVMYVLIMEEDDNVIDDNFSSDEDNESSQNSSRDGEGGVPHPQWATLPQHYIKHGDRHPVRMTSRLSIIRNECVNSINLIAVHGQYHLNVFAVCKQLELLGSAPHSFAPRLMISPVYRTVRCSLDYSSRLL